MRIIIDLSQPPKSYFTEYFNRYVTSALAGLNKEQSRAGFYFIITGPSNVDACPQSLPGQVIIKKSIRLLPRWQIRGGRQLKAIIKKTKADLLITVNGHASAKAGIPQCLWLAGMEKNHYTRKYWGKITKNLNQTLQYVEIIFTRSEKDEQYLLQQYPSARSKIIVIPPVADERYRLLSWADKEKIKTSYAKGREYFLIEQPASSLADLINILKAFAQFKKRQQSNMQLVMVAKHLTKDQIFSLKLDTFKYRDDVHLYTSIDETELKKIFASAYALIQPVENDLDFLSAFNAGVPVISNQYKEDHDPSFANAILRVAFHDPAQLAGQLMLLYTNENFRGNLIEEGKKILLQLNPQQQSDKLWDGLMGAMRSRKSQ